MGAPVLPPGEADARPWAPGPPTLPGPLHGLSRSARSRHCCTSRQCASFSLSGSWAKGACHQGLPNRGSQLAFAFLHIPLPSPHAGLADLLRQRLGSSVAEGRVSVDPPSTSLTVTPDPHAGAPWGHAVLMRRADPSPWRLASEPDDLSSLDFVLLALVCVFLGGEPGLCAASRAAVARHQGRGVMRRRG